MSETVAHDAKASEVVEQYLETIYNMGMEGDVVTLQDLFVFEIIGEDATGRVVGRHRFTGLRPSFWEHARYFGKERELAEIMSDDNG